MSWENDAAGYLAELSRSPGGVQPATIGEVWDSEWKRTALDTIGGVGQPFGDARADLVTAIETAAGRPIADYAAQMGVKLGAGVTQAEDIRLLGTLADTLPEEKRKSIEPLKDVRLNAAKKAQKIEADADEIGNATYGLTAHATAFIAGVARQASDPVNVAAMVATAPLGAARGASFLATIGREAGANAAAQAAVEPIIEPQRERLGLESGFGRAAGNVLEAGIGGAALSGLFHVAGRGLRSLRADRAAESAQAAAPVEGTVTAPAAAERASAPDPVPAGPLAPPRPVEQFAPDDFHAAGDLAERDHVVDMMSPLDTAEGRFDHAAKVDEAAQRIDNPASKPAESEFVRFYHGGAEPGSGGPRWLTPSYEYARNFRSDGMPNDVHYVDVPRAAFADRADLASGFDDINGIYRNFEAPEDIALQLRAMPEIKSVDVTPKVPRGRAAADPETFSLNEFIASQGGLKPDPELAAIYGTKGGPFVPGFGKLIRKGGKTLDEALTAAKEAGYLTDASDLDGPGNGTIGIAGRRDLGLTPNDLLDRLDAENRGQRSYRPGRERQAAIDDGEEAHAIIGALEKELYDTGGGDIRVDQIIADRVVQIIRKEKETDLLSAYERAIMEDAERYEGLAAARASDAELSKVEGWDIDDAGATSRDGAPDPQQRRQAERSGQGDGGKDGATSRDAGDGDGASRKLGDPALAADAIRAIEDAGGDLDITLINPDGTTRTLKASDALREVEEDAVAAEELMACIAGAAEEAPF